jgi:hypothetical protein
MKEISSILKKLTNFIESFALLRIHVNFLLDNKYFEKYGYLFLNFILQFFSNVKIELNNLQLVDQKLLNKNVS